MSPNASPQTLPFKYRRKSLSVEPSPPSPSPSPSRPYPSSSRYADQFSPYNHKSTSSSKWAHTTSDDDFELPFMSDDAASVAPLTESYPSSPSLAPPSPRPHDAEDVYVDIVSSSPVRDSAFVVSASTRRSRLPLLRCDSEQDGYEPRCDKAFESRTRVEGLIHQRFSSQKPQPNFKHDNTDEDVAAALLALHAQPRLSVPQVTTIPTPAPEPPLSASRSASLHFLLSPLDPPAPAHASPLTTAPAISSIDSTEVARSVKTAESSIVKEESDLPVDVHEAEDLPDDLPEVDGHERGVSPLSSLPPSSPFSDALDLESDTHVDVSYDVSAIAGSTSDETHETDVPGDHTDHAAVSTEASVGALVKASSEGSSDNVGDFIDDDLLVSPKTYTSSPLSSPPSSPVLVHAELPASKSEAAHDLPLSDDQSTSAPAPAPRRKAGSDERRSKKRRLVITWTDDEDEETHFPRKTAKTHDNACATGVSESKKLSSHNKPDVKLEPRLKSKPKVKREHEDKEDADLSVRARDRKATPHAAQRKSRRPSEKSRAEDRPKHVAKSKPKAKRKRVESSDEDDGDTQAGSIQTDAETNPDDGMPSEPEPPLLGIVIETLAFARASSWPAEVVWREVKAAYPGTFGGSREASTSSDYGDDDDDGGRARVESVLEWGVRRRVFGRIESSGESLPPSYFYLAALDPDRERGALLATLAPRPAKRAETMKYKQYYWRPVRMAVPERRSGRSTRKKEKTEADEEHKEHMWEVDWEES
ncbi:hypothetical protein DENSPDRAFT_839147 [Dentipellis sp. KUC8613]|nr:hypothetical protein DENSPDRAFT_839147 [Dentipellis sp. KUC8613]